jgi:alkaline phosphatase D
MKKTFLFFLLGIIVITSCNEKKPEIISIKETDSVASSSVDFTIVFASCNDQDREQPLWNPILENEPDLFIWGGDNIYADTSDMLKMESDYRKQRFNPDYAKLVQSTKVIGTWDDHDYGLNDAGVEWEHKEGAKELFLDFLDFPFDDPLRAQKGTYYSRKYTTSKGAIKVILLDTRYFRDSLRKSRKEGWRYEAWGLNEGGTVLGKAQWNWLENELKDESAQYTLIVSSIQFLADEHGWEKWGNHPSEVNKMYETFKKAKSKNILIVSGDRHLAEFSINKEAELPYDLVDFTTSGLTHTYPDSPDTPNRHRVGRVIKDLNFGVLQFNIEGQKVHFEVRGVDNEILEKLDVQY